MTYARLLFGLFLAACVAPAAIAQQVERRTVRVAIVDDEPVFDPEVVRLHPRARPMAAIVERRHPSGDGSSMLLLSPAHADAETLAAAIETLATCPRPGPGGGMQEGTVLRPGTRMQRGGEAELARAEAILAELRTAPTGEIPNQGYRHGRYVDVPDMEACLPPHVRRRMGPDGRIIETPVAPAAPQTSRPR